MQKVSVLGADGQRRILALVRSEGDTLYVCPLDRYSRVIAGQDDTVVGFPAADVEPVLEPVQ
jgi:hypothetical protein